jgi:hypothetical protein
MPEQRLSILVHSSLARVRSSGLPSICCAQGVGIGSANCANSFFACASGQASESTPMLSEAARLKNLWNLLLAPGFESTSWMMRLVKPRQGDAMDRLW